MKGTRAAAAWISGASSIVGKQLVFEAGTLRLRGNTGNGFAVASAGRSSFIVKAAPGHTDAGERLRGEAEWYEQHHGTPASSLFPRYYGSAEAGGYRIVTLEYLGTCRTLRDLLLRGDTTPAAAADILSRILDAFGVGAGAAAPRSEVHRLMRARIDHRAGLLRGAIAKRPALLGNADLHDRLSINGHPPISIEEAISAIASIADRLASSSIGFRGSGHGDLHLENVLVDTRGRFHLVDPNAAASRLPLYDLGKCFMSLHGRYDLIHGERYRLQRNAAEWTLRFSSRADGMWEAVARLFEADILRRSQHADAASVIAIIRRTALVHWLCLLPHHTTTPHRFRAMLARMLELLRHDALA
jgi:Phosphotransferase enzyme family